MIPTSSCREKGLTQFAGGFVGGALIVFIVLFPGFHKFSPGFYKDVELLPPLRACPDNTVAQHRRLHRFCANGKQFDLCGHQFEDISDTQRKSLGCLRLESLKAETEEECRRFEKAFALLTDPKAHYRLTYYMCHHCVRDATEASSRSSFYMVGPWNPPWNGINFINNEFEQDAYDIERFKLSGAEGRVLDVGGNIGYFSVATGLSFPGARIATFEPQPLNFLLLYHNVVANGLAESVRAFNKALAPPTTPSVMMDYYLINPGASEVYDYGTPGNLVAARAEDHFEIPTITFDAALSKIDVFDSQTTRFTLKLDCEGCEFFIIDRVRAHVGQLQTLRGETHDPLRTRPSNASVAETVQFFRKHDPTYKH